MKQREIRFTGKIINFIDEKDNLKQILWGLCILHTDSMQKKIHFFLKFYLKSLD